MKERFISFLTDLRDYFILKGVILQISYRSSFSHRLLKKIVESSKSTNIILRRSEGSQKAVRRHQYFGRVLGQNAHIVYRPDVVGLEGMFHQITIHYHI